MPIFRARCQCGFEKDQYLERAWDRQQLRPCPECRHILFYKASWGQPMRYFESSRPRTIWNLSHEPQVISSYQEHREAMKRAGVAEAPQRRGMPGCWS